VLIFGPFDPSGSSNLPADAVTCAQLGGHALSVLTGMHVQDTAGIEEIHSVAPEFVDDQARCLLEDMAVGAMKAGSLYTIESISAVAQIVADYSPVPLVLHLGALPDDDLLADDHDAEELIGSICELILPQTDLVIADHNLIAHWIDHGLLDDRGAPSIAHALLEYHAKWALVTGTPLRPRHHYYQLLGPDNETFNWPFQPAPERVIGTESALSCAVTLELARGRAMAQAVELAIGQVQAMAGNAFQPGMGYRLVGHWPS